MESLCSRLVRVVALAFLLAGPPGTTHAADNAAPVHNVDGSFVREWLILSPFPAKGLESDFLAVAGGEANVRPKEGDAIARSDGTRLTWTRLRAKTDLVMSGSSYSNRCHPGGRTWNSTSLPRSLVGTDSTPSHLFARGVEALETRGNGISGGSDSPSPVQGLDRRPEGKSGTRMERVPTENGGSVRKADGANGSPASVEQAFQPAGLGDFPVARFTGLEFCGEAGWPGLGVFRYDGKGFFRLGVENGLLSDKVLDIAETSDGALWFGTQGGIFKLEGGQLLRVLDRTWVIALDSDDQGNLRFGSRQGLHRLERVRDTGGTGGSPVLPQNGFKRISITTTNGLPDQHIWCSACTRDDKIWMGTDRNGLLGYDGKAVTVPWYANTWIAVSGGSTFVGLFLWAFIARALYMRKRQEAERLRERLLEQESQALEALEGKNRQLQEAKEAADTANRAKNTFLANMSHEIRTPLNAVLGYAQILQRDESLGDDQRQSVATIERSGSHLLTRINEILDPSKIEAGHMEVSETDFDLRELILGLSEMFELRCRQKGLEWRVEFECGAGSAECGVQSQEAAGEFTAENAEIAEKEAERRPSDPSLRSLRSLRLTSDLTGNSIPVHGDEVKLRQVLINLLGNAVKFTDAGRVTLRVAGKWGGAGDPPVPVGLPVRQTGPTGQASGQSVSI